jgi:hypothetical protein
MRCPDVVTLVLRVPLLRFAVLGIALYCAAGSYGRSSALTTAPDAGLLYQAAVTLGIDRDAALVHRRLAQLGEILELEESPAGPSGEQAARDLGLVETDPVIRRHIEQLAELALQHGGTALLPTDTEVAQYYATEQRRFARPPSVRLTQIYFSFERQGAATEANAQAALARLRAEQLLPRDVGAWGDPFVLSFGTRVATHDDLVRAFGTELAVAIDSVPDRSWAGPLRSAYGMHLVWIHERQPAGIIPLADVRNQIIHRLARERGARLATQRLEILRQTAARPAS